DLHALILTLPALAERWRALEFSDGRVVVNGVPLAGLTTTRGVHPRPGVQYRLLFGAPEQIWLIDVVHDDSMRTQVRLNDESRRQAVDVTMHRPKRPDRLELTASIEGGAGRFT